MATADLHSAVLEMFAGLEADERLAGQGLAEAFAEAFPAVPAASSVPSLTTSTSWARVAALLGVSSLDILDVTQANAKDVVTTIRRIRLQLEKQGTRINWRHVKGHSREKGGPISHGNETADALADKGKKCNETEGTWIHVTSTQDYDGVVQHTEDKRTQRKLLFGKQ